jgi:hypothetical protein
MRRSIGSSMAGAEFKWRRASLGSSLWLIEN